MSLEIKTNNIPRDILYGYDLTEKEMEEFDYIREDDKPSARFFRYKGNV